MPPLRTLLPCKPRWTVFYPPNPSQPWPATLTDQVRTIKDSLRAKPLQTPQQIATGFKPASRTRVVEILETLTALGQTRVATEDRYTM